MFNSLKSRLWLSYSLIILFVLSVVGIGLLLSLRNNPQLYRQPIAQLEAVAESAITQYARTKDPIVLQSQIKSVAIKTGARLTLYNIDGSLFYDSDRMPGAEIKLEPSLTASTPGEVRFISDVRGNSWLYFLKPLNEHYYIMTSSRRPRLPLQLLLREDLFKPLVRAGLYAMLIAVALAILLGNWVEAPLQKLARQSIAVSRGEAQPIPLEGPVEVRQLFGAFNEMVSRLNASTKSQRDFIANVSHELKTPLTSIQGFAQAILDQKPSSPAETGQSAHIILDEAQRMNRMVMGLLTLARLDAGLSEPNLEAVNLQALLRNILERMTPLAQSNGVTLNNDLDAVPELMVNPENLTQIIVNLIENAIKYTPSGGKILVSCHQVDQHVELHVRDTGRGISIEDQARIFERFYQADKSRSGGEDRGLGLGLAIASQMVQSMHGTISVVSEPGQGSDFMVKLPIE